MGRRSRRRDSSGQTLTGLSKAESRDRRSRARPRAPWEPFPLVELAVFVALVLLILGFFLAGKRGQVALFAGLALGSLAGLELVLREHLSGYRSHTTAISGVVAFLAALLMRLGGVDYNTILPTAIAVLVLAWYPLRRIFKVRERSYRVS